MSRASPSSLHKIDSTDRSVGIDTDHDKIHNGERFTIFNESVLASAGILNILLVVPASVQTHLILTVSGTLGGVVRVFKGTTYSATGSAVTKFNKNDAYPTATGSSLFYTGPTITADGTQFAGLNFASGKNAGSDASFKAERVLGPDLTYLFRIVSDDNNNRVVTTFDWYEVSV